MAAINALSTYNLSSSRLDRSHHRDLRHVACAVYVRMARYYDTHRRPASWQVYLQEMAMPYTMFASAVFFAPERHEGCEYRLDPIHITGCAKRFLGMHADSRQQTKEQANLPRRRAPATNACAWPWTPPIP